MEKVKEMKATVNKYRTLPPVLFMLVICSLLFAACINPLNQQTGAPQEIPPGMGAFSLTIGKVNMRTIMPESGLGHFAVYTLSFFAADTGSFNTLLMQTDISAGDLINNTAPSIFLAPGSYDLRVTAYTDAGKQKPAATGMSLNIVIINGTVVPRVINLEPIEAGKGIFTWSITLPAGLDAASMKISPLDTSGTPEETVPFTFDDDEAEINTGNRELNTGYYLLTFSLSKPGTQSIMLRELLHIYQNLESILESEFEDDHFNRSHYTVTFEFDNGTADLVLDYWHGDTVSSITPTKTGYTFEGWFKDDDYTDDWDFDTDTVTANITLYAKWEAVPGTTPDAPFLVNDEDDLRKVGTGTGGWTLSAHYRQTADIDLTDKANWTRIDGGYDNPFTGSYNGGGYAITGLTIIASTQYQGMFGCIGTGGKVENLGLIDVDINAANCVGGIAGANYGTIQNCYVIGVIGGNIEFVGGITGPNNGTIQNCYVTGNVTSNYGVGGITGPNNSAGSIWNCVTLNESVTLTSNSTTTIGRIIGLPYGTQQNNYAWSGMTLTDSDGPVTLSPSITGGGGNGANITAAEAKTAASWTNAGRWDTINGSAWDFDTVWQWNGDSGMPSLKNSEGNSTVPPWPDYLYDEPPDMQVTGSTLADKLAWVRNESNVENGGTYRIEVTANETIAPQTFSYSSRNNITIILWTSGGERVVSLSSNGSHFTVENTVTLVLNNNITLQGSSGNNASLVRVNAGGALEMNTGVKITGNNSATGGGGVLVLANATFTMNGGEISNNTSSNDSNGGGGVRVVNGTFTMSGGKISGNTSPMGGGGVNLQGSAFTMSGGEISGNIDSGSGGGGGVSVLSSSTFTMTGGTISGNTSVGGGGVYMDSSTFRIVTGTIYGSDAATVLANATNPVGRGAALLTSSGTAQCGTFSGETWSGTNLIATSSGIYHNNTIDVLNGELVP